MKVKSRITDRILDSIDEYSDQGGPFARILNGSIFGWLSNPVLHIVDFFCSAASHLRREKKEFEE